MQEAQDCPIVEFLSEPKTNMIIIVRAPCGIPISDTDGEKFIIIGGKYTQNTVSVYGTTGWIENLQSIHQGREEPGCTSFVSNNKRVIKHFLH